MHWNGDALYPLGAGTWTEEELGAMILKFEMALNHTISHWVKHGSEACGSDLPPTTKCIRISVGRFHSCVELLLWTICFLLIGILQGEFSRLAVD